jgi:putative ABC transport system ATP-binding protein
VPADALLTAQDVHLAYGPNPALRGASVGIAARETVALTGPSGSGKSSLLYCLAGIVRPDRGRISHDGNDITEMDDDERSEYRRRRFGFVFQFGDLIPELSLLENVALPLRLNSVPGRRAREQSLAMLTRLGIGKLADKRPGGVSGGEAQRAAVARALVHKPAVVFADEPTGSLDATNGRLVLAELIRLAREENAGVLLVTHEEGIAAACDRRIQLVDGVVRQAASL